MNVNSEVNSTSFTNDIVSRNSSYVSPGKPTITSDVRLTSGILSGRTSGNIIVEFAGEESLVGQFAQVKITEARNWILRGKLA